MPLDMHTLCRYRMARAEEDLLTAENNHQSDFFIASKEDSEVQLNNAKMFLHTVKRYLEKKEKEHGN